MEAAEEAMVDPEEAPHRCTRGEVQGDPCMAAAVGMVDTTITDRAAAAAAEVAAVLGTMMNITMAMVVMAAAAITMVRTMVLLPAAVAVVGMIISLRLEGRCKEAGRCTGAWEAVWEAAGHRQC